MRLFSIYWKIASLIPISILLLIGDRPLGYLTSFISPILLTICIWFWVDLNEELADLPLIKPLPLLVKIWRWIISLYSILFTTLTFISIPCLNLIDGKYCNSWKEAPQNFHHFSSNLFKFLFGANWTESVAAFIGYIALLVYVVGLLQWLLVRFPKQGRMAGGF